MELHITKHAIMRYRERLCDYTSPDKRIVHLLKIIAEKGKVVDSRPGVDNKCLEVYCNGIAIVLAVNGNHATIITCLGDATYRKWVKRQSRYIAGRTRFPRQVV